MTSKPGDSAPSDRPNGAAAGPRASRMPLHVGELEIDAELARRLVAARLPELADLPITEVRSTGTVNALFRIGDDLCARLPRLPQWAADLEKEARLLPELALGMTLQIPEPVHLLPASREFPLPWAIFRWIGGRPYADDLIEDERRAADDLAQFVVELRAVDVPIDAPGAGRRPLRELDVMTRAAIQQAGDRIDGEAAAAAWDLALRAPVWTGRPRWIHADLLRPNILVRDQQLTAVIDFGSAGVGDPAADIIPAWSVFGTAGRDRYRQRLDSGDGSWERARGVALHQAALIIPYYAESNPEFAASAIRTVEQVVADVRE